MCSPQDLPFLNPACSLRSIGSRAVEILFRITPARSLRSADSNLITTNIYRLERCGRRRFSVAGPFLWNKLPASVKSANSLGAFKSALKTHLFREAFMTLL